MEIISTQIVPSEVTITLGATVCLFIVNTYSDGTTCALTTGIGWYTNSSAVSISTSGVITGNSVGNATISAVVSSSGVIYQLPVTVTTSLVYNNTSSYRSHLTQTLLNYFDPQDIRIREEPYTIDAQLLNLAAMSIDDKNQRVVRELESRVINNCPTQVDNFGCYFSTPLSKNYPLLPEQTCLNTCIGTLPEGGTVIIPPYDDRLPTPTSYGLDIERTTTGLTTPILFEVTGSGDPVTQIWNVQTLGSYALAIPNKLSFWAENVGGNNMSVDVFIQGSVYPASVFLDQQIVSSETLNIINEGYIESVLVWQDISSIVVRGLPAGVKLKCFQIPVGLPGIPDKDRPYTNSTYRDDFFDRYWVVDRERSLLKEMYMMDNFSTLEYIQSYAIPYNFSSFAPEPNTWGGVGSFGTNLIYVDRREPLPSNLNSTAITSSPMYGLDVYYDILESRGLNRSVVLIPKPYGNSENMLRWRYIRKDPAGNVLIINPEGTTVSYTGNAGWQEGNLPNTLRNELSLMGTYVFTLECFGSDGTISEASFPYPNLQLPLERVFNLSNITANIIRAVFFDHSKQLWVWDGLNIIPIRPIYNYYLLDIDNKTLYFTNQYTEVVYS